MNSPASILFDIDGNPVGVSGSMMLPTGALGQLIAGVDQSGKVRYLNFISSSIMVTGSLGLVGSSVVTGSIAVSNFPSVQTVTGSVAVGNQIFVTTTGSIPVTVGNFPAIQTVTGSVEIANFPAVQVVTGTVALTAQPISVSGTLNTAITGTVTVTSTGSLSILERRSSLTTTSSVNASNSTSQILLSSSLNRLQGLVFNDSTGQLYLTLGSSSSTTSFTVRLDSRAYYEVPIYYVGTVSGIWSNNNGAARLTEIKL